VAIAVVVTLGVQATTKRWLAHRLGLLEPAPAASVEAQAS
jgi:hypothetical protein